jgi:hypothetical protein
MNEESKFISDFESTPLRMTDNQVTMLCNHFQPSKTTTYEKWQFVLIPYSVISKHHHVPKFQPLGKSSISRTFSSSDPTVSPRHGLIGIR